MLLCTCNANANEEVARNQAEIKGLEARIEKMQKRLEAAEKVVGVCEWNHGSDQDIEPCLEAWRKECGK